MDESEAAAFILENTRPLAPPLTPEVVLQLASESLPIWLKTEEELGAMNVPPPYWAFAWAGGQALARYVLDHPRIVAGKSVVDVGAGSGLVAIAAARAGAQSVLALEVDQLAAAAIRINSTANRASVSVSSQDVLGGAPLPTAEVLLVGDVFYERDLADRVWRLIEAAQRRGTDVLVGDPRRSYFPAERFEQVKLYEVPVTRELEDAEIKRTAVWRLAGSHAG